MKMIRLIAVLLIPVLTAVLVLGMSEFADAKRFGGGKSFGSKPMFSKSFSKPVPNKAPLGGNKAGLNKTPQSRRGLFGGMFGGLLAGTLLGSLLFGGGFGGFGFMDIILLVIAFVFIRKLFRSRRMETQQNAYQGGGYSNYNQQQAQSYEQETTMQRESHDAWSNLRSTPAGGSQAQDVQPDVTVPAGFDTEDFLKGAKVVFNRLQTSWDARDLNDIKQFTTQEVYEAIKQQAQDDPQPSRTEILMANARLLEVKEESEGTLATVYFDVLMREDKSAQQPEQVREVWHFLKAKDSESMWLLDGIQQLEN